MKGTSDSSVIHLANLGIGLKITLDFITNQLLCCYNETRKQLLLNSLVCVLLLNWDTACALVMGVEPSARPQKSLIQRVNI